MSLAIKQIHAVFVGEVSGVDLTKPISREEVEAIEDGMNQYAVLVFRDQAFTDEQQMAFTMNFGPLENARGGNSVRSHEGQHVAMMRRFSRSSRKKRGERFSRVTTTPGTSPSSTSWSTRAKVSVNS